MWTVEFTDEFGEWWTGLDESVQDAIDRSVRILESVGPSLGRPHVDTIQGSRHAHMKELRVQAGGDPYRIFFCFDPRRTGILLIGGGKRGDKLFYDRMIPIADRLYDTYLSELKKEGLI
jgi:hypothetical protein